MYSKFAIWVKVVTTVIQPKGFALARKRRKIHKQLTWCIPIINMSALFVFQNNKLPIYFNYQNEGDRL